MEFVVDGAFIFSRAYFFFFFNLVLTSLIFFFFSCTNKKWLKFLLIFLSVNGTFNLYDKYIKTDAVKIQWTVNKREPRVTEREREKLEARMKLKREVLGEIFEEALTEDPEMAKQFTIYLKNRSKDVRF